jgi:hypothetical protein
MSYQTLPSHDRATQLTHVINMKIMTQNDHSGELTRTFSADLVKVTGVLRSDMPTEGKMATFLHFPPKGPRSSVFGHLVSIC